MAGCVRALSALLSTHNGGRALVCKEAAGCWVSDSGQRVGEGREICGKLLLAGMAWVSRASWPWSLSPQQCFL